MHRYEVGLSSIANTWIETQFWRLSVLNQATSLRRATSTNSFPDVNPPLSKQTTNVNEVLVHCSETILSKLGGMLHWVLKAMGTSTSPGFGEESLERE
jgi:hypothetical protein